MKSNYKKIGEHIQLVDERNTGLKVKEFLGLSISKQFIPSVANIIGTDMENYKVIRKNQFACSTMQVRRDKKMPVALLQEVDEAIISQAYPVFEVKDENELLPEYLMMWFTRSEFDREACFHAVGGVRGSLEWEDFCDMQLPIPSPAKQKEIIKEYKVIQNRIALNQQLIQKLEETAQAIYKQWFVDFEFPDETGKPYKSNGGEMIFDKELEKEIPHGWNYGQLGDLIEVVNGYAFGSEDFGVCGGYPIIKIANIIPPEIKLETAQYFSGDLNNSIKKSLVEYGDILISMTGSHMNQINSAVGKIGRYNYDSPAIMNQRVGMLKPRIECSEFLLQIVSKEETQKEVLMSATGSANQANISPQTIKSVGVIIPSTRILKLFEECGSKIRIQKDNYGRQNTKLNQLKSLLLSKLATIEN